MPDIIFNLPASSLLINTYPFILDITFSWIDWTLVVIAAMQAPAFGMAYIDTTESYADPDKNVTTIKSMLSTLSK